MLELCARTTLRLSLIDAAKVDSSWTYFLTNLAVISGLSKAFRAICLSVKFDIFLLVVLSARNVQLSSSCKYGIDEISACNTITIGGHPYITQR